MHGSRIPHPHFPDVSNRFFETTTRSLPPGGVGGSGSNIADPPPAHRATARVAPPPSTVPYGTPSPVPIVQQSTIVSGGVSGLSATIQTTLETSKTVLDFLEREQRQQQLRAAKERSSIPG